MPNVDLYYILPSPPCRAVLLCAKAMDLELNLKLTNLLEKEHLTPEFLAMNPTHGVPTMADNGFYLWESRAILAYLVNKYGKEDDPLYPKDPTKRALVDRLLYFDIGTLYKAFGDYVFPQLFKKLPADPEKLEAIKTAVGYLDLFLGQNKYAAGDHLTIADLSLASSAGTLEAIDFDFSEYPKVEAWLQKLKNDLPYYKESNQDGIDAFKGWFQQMTGKA